MENLYIIDGNSLVNRAFYALPALCNEQGEYSNAIYGFCNILVKLITENNIENIVVAFDFGRKTFRNEMYAEYKGTRKGMPEELALQMPVLKSLLEKMNITHIEKEGIEADDIIGTICKNSGCKNFVLTADRDILQLIDNNTEVWITKKGVTDILKVTQDNIVMHYGYTPNQIIESKALCGDKSDNIPGVPNVGDVSAKKLLDKYSTLDGVYENLQSITGKLKEKLTEFKELAYLSLRLATIKTDCDIETDIKNFAFDFPFKKSVKDVFEHYSFKSLLRRTELFREETAAQSKQEIKILNSLQEIKDVLKNTKAFLAFDFTDNYTFAIDDSCNYQISSTGDLFSFAEINLDSIIECFKEVFFDDSIVKVCSSIKQHLNLHDIFFEIGNIFDITLASYLVYAGDDWSVDFDVNLYFCEMEKLNLKMQELDLEKVYNKIELPLCYLLCKMEKRGFFVDKEELNRLSLECKTELEYLNNQIQKLAGEEFNVNSPKQLAGILFDKLKLDTSFNTKRSTNVEVLKSLEGTHEIIDYILRQRKLQKINSTYIEVYKDNLLKNDDYIYTIFNQTITATGRLSSSEPNLQNIPIRDEFGKKLRKIFVSRFNGGQIMSADYSQIELRLLAEFSRDELLVKSFLSLKDVHKQTAAEIFDKNILDVTEEERKIAKAVNFGIIYGISAYGLSQQLKTSPVKAKFYIEKYFDKYKTVPLYMKEQIEFAKENGYAKTYFGRIRKINSLNAKNKILKQYGERIAMNMPLQGSASDIIKLAMIEVEREMQKLNLKSKLILQIHDELIVDCEKSEVEIVKNILKEKMENVCKFTIPLDVDINYGKTWFDAK